jgi:hypothetical protein
MNEVVVRQDGDLVCSGFVLQRNGLYPKGNPTFEEWIKVGDFIKKSNQSVQFWLGDWLNYGEARWGEKYSQALETTEYALGTLQNAAWVASNVDPVRRRAGLSFSHHQTVAHLPPQEQEILLDEAEEKQLTVGEFRKLVYKSNKVLNTTCPKCGFTYEIQSRKNI